MAREFWDDGLLDPRISQGYKQIAKVHVVETNRLNPDLRSGIESGRQFDGGGFTWAGNAGQRAGVVATWSGNLAANPL